MSAVQVALLAEGVDRNIQPIVLSGGTLVALLAEGVDRNISPYNPVPHYNVSPSSRRAWIEM